MAVRAINRRGKRRLVLDINYRTPNGKKARYRHDAEVPTWSAARAEERRRLAALAATGSPYEVIDKEARAQVAPELPKGPTLGEVATMYVETHLPTCKPSTAANYPYTINRWLIPRLGNVPISEVDYDKVLAVQNAVRAKGNSEGSVRSVGTVLRSILRFAGDRKLIPELPKLPKLPPKRRTILSTYKDGEMRAMLAAAKRPEHRIAIMLAAFAGLRACEIRGLRGADLDLQSRTLTVRRAVTLGKTHKPKSGHERIVPILDELHAELVARGTIGRNDLVAPNALGKEWGQHGLYELFDRIAKRAGLTHLSRFVHNLRHYFGTALFRAGVNPRVAQKLLGHADLTTTMRYAHVEANDLKHGIGRLESFVEPCAGRACPQQWSATKRTVRGRSRVGVARPSWQLSCNASRAPNATPIGTRRNRKSSVAFSMGAIPLPHSSLPRVGVPRDKRAAPPHPLPTVGAPRGQAGLCPTPSRLAAIHV